MNNKFLIFIIIVLVIGAWIFYLPKKEKMGLVNTDLKTTEVATSTATTSSTGTFQTYNISIENFSYSEKELIINKGDTVIWKNIDRVPHDVVGTTLTNLKSPIMGYGLTYSFTFNEVGTYEYFCSLHPSMKAKVIVK